MVLETPRSQYGAVPDAPAVQYGAVGDRLFAKALQFEAPDFGMSGALQFDAPNIELPEALFDVRGPNKLALDWGRPGGLRIPARRRVNGAAVLLAMLVPWGIFCATFALLAFELRHNYPSLSYFGCGITLFITCVFGYLSWFHVLRRSAGDVNAEPLWFVFIFGTALACWFAALATAQYNYVENMRPVYDVRTLNTYDEVNPDSMRGQELMDAGQVTFVDGARLDLGKSMGFINLDKYCVAPIVVGNGTLETYDFWAVGINCCSSNVGDYRCGEFSNPAAQSGLRLMDERERDFFRLAVQQAEAAYSIRADHPLLFYWLQDTQDEIAAYAFDGHRLFTVGALSVFGIQFILILCGVVCFSKYDFQML